MKKEDAAFPVFCGDAYSSSEGMSKRFYAACAAMQGILSNSNTELDSTKSFGNKYENLVKSAYIFADELLKQEKD